VGLDALLITLAAAVVHASWNALLAGSEDTAAATAVAILIGGVAYLPVAVLTWDVDAAVWPWAVGSVAFETVYVALLAAAYTGADMSVVYPVARGSAPVLVLAVGGVPGVRQAIGVVTVAAGILAVRGFSRVREARDVLLALGVGACIASYTLIDARGLDFAGALPYLWLTIAPVGWLYALGIASRRGGARRLRAAVAPRTAVAGLGFFGAYGLVLVALTLAPAAAVAAVRETSVVFAVALGAVSLGEPVGRARVAGAIVVTVGIVLVAA
jgi:drug/metabolite transporter (DMT)-like permease